MAEDRLVKTYHVYTLSDDRSHYQFQESTTEDSLVAAIRLRMSALIFNEYLGERIDGDGTPWVHNLSGTGKIRWGLGGGNSECTDGEAGRNA